MAVHTSSNMNRTKIQRLVPDQRLQRDSEGIQTGTSNLRGSDAVRTQQAEVPKPLVGRPATGIEAPRTFNVVPHLACHFDGCDTEHGQCLHGHGDRYAQRFWTKVDRFGPLPADDTLAAGSGRCWIWRDAPDHAHYARYRLGKFVVYVHRYVYVRANGPIPAGMHIDHRCHVRNCVNPAHLEAVSPSINSKRSWDRRRRRQAENLGPCLNWIAPSQIDFEPPAEAA